MSSILNLIFRIITAAYLLIKETRKLTKEISGFFYSSAKNSDYKEPLFITHSMREPKKMSKVDYQIEIEKLFHKNQLFPRIQSEFSNNEIAPGITFESYMVKAGIDPTFGFDLLVQMVLHKRVQLPVLVGILRKHFGGDCQMTADAILMAAEADLVDWSAPLLTFIVRFDISQDVQDDLDRYQYPLPMVVPPKTLNNNHDTGYYTSRNSVILRDNHHDNDVCLDHLNHMNRIKLRINSKTARMIQNRWRNLDKPKPGEDRKDYLKRVKAFEKYDRTARDVMVHLDIADSLSHDEDDAGFYLTHKYDKRGRVYCQGYHVNYQGTPWNKAVIEFANEEVTT